MKKKLLAATIGSLIALSMGSALAQQPGPYGESGRMEGRNGEPHRMEARRVPYNIQGRIDAQQREIRMGQREGRLNRREAAILNNNLSKIKSDFNRAKRSDRFVSMEERARLDQMLERNGRMIRRMENNAITRF